MQKTLSVMALGAALAGCTTGQEKSVAAEIGRIEGRVLEKEARIESATGELGAQQQDLLARAAYRPIQAWGRSLSAAPPAQRTFEFRQTSRHGQIESRRINNPWWLPDGEWYVEIDNGTATKARLVLGSFDFQPAANGLTLRTPMDFHIESRIHAHFDPGPGGGIGTNIFIDGDKRFETLLRASFLPVRDGKIPYRLALVSPDSLKITISAHLGRIGNYGHPFEMKNLARTLAEGSLNMLFDAHGPLGPLPDGSTFTYQLTTSNPTLVTDEHGLAFSSDVRVDIRPTGG